MIQHHLVRDRPPPADGTERTFSCCSCVHTSMKKRGPPTNIGEGRQQQVDLYDERRQAGREDFAAQEHRGQGRGGGRLRGEGLCFHRHWGRGKRRKKHIFSSFMDLALPSHAEIRSRTDDSRFHDAWHALHVGTGGGLPVSCFIPVAWFALERPAHD